MRFDSLDRETSSCDTSPSLVCFSLLCPHSRRETTLEEARERWLRGNYEEAQALYEDLGKDAKNQPAATIGLSRALESQGEYDKALGVLEPALQKHTKNVDLLARHAEILYRRGRWDDAKKAVDAALKIDANQFLARWVQAQFYRDTGDIKKADTEMRWFVKEYMPAEVLPTTISKMRQNSSSFALAGTENARWHNISDQFQFILDEVYTDAIKVRQSVLAR